VIRAVRGMLMSDVRKISKQKLGKELRPKVKCPNYTVLRFYLPGTDE
jgi:hypothetical protein